MTVDFGTLLFDIIFKEVKTMKKFLLFSMIIVLFGSIFAVEDTSLLEGDDTVKIYERKAVMGFGDIGFQQDKITAAMAFCETNGKSMNCVPWSVLPLISVPVTYDSKTAAAKIFYEWTITNRMDKIILGNGAALVMTRGDEIKMATPGIPNFVSGTSDIKTFKSNVENYLNSDVKNIFGKLLDASLEARYSELPEKEQETFITTKAKELGISADFASRLLSSAFVFAAHVESVGGVGSVIHANINVPQVPGVKALPAYSVVVTLNVNVDFLIYHYNYEKKEFELYKKIVGKSGPVPAQETSVVIPTPGMATRAFNKAFRDAMKAASINASYELKKDDNFALFIPVKSVEGGKKIETSMGVMEDIRVDHPFSINETVDGKVVNKGWARARKIAKNCPNSGSDEMTLITVTNGEAEEGDQLREHPWTGLFFNFGLGSNATYLAHNKNRWREYPYDAPRAKFLANGSMFAAPSIHIGALFDLGYMTDSAAASEFYFDFFLDFDYSVYLGKSYKNAGIRDTTTSFGTSWFSGGFGISKRFYASSGGFFFAPALQFGAGGGWGSYGTGKDAEFVKVTFTPQLQFGWSTTPDFDFVIKAGWNLGALAKAKLKDSGFVEPSNFNKFAHGLFFSFDFNFHLPVVGATAKTFKAPSNICHVKKKEKTEEDDQQVKENADDALGNLEEGTAETASEKTATEENTAPEEIEDTNASNADNNGNVESANENGNDFDNEDFIFEE